MAILDIVKYPDERLKQECSQVNSFDSALHALLDSMLETMYAADGIGLAAPQVGELIQATVIDISRDGSEPLELINPEIVGNQGQESSEEGCLSIPEYRDVIKRSSLISVRAFNRHGQQFEIEASDLLGICMQHEIDHLNGILFIDHLSRLKREMFKRWYKKHGPFE